MKLTMQAITQAFSILAILSVSFSSWAEDTQESVSVIQERLFDKSHEIGVMVGYIPGDFYESFPIGGSYTYHFNDNIAWEVIRGEYVVRNEKDIKGKLEDEFQVEPQQFDGMQYMLHTSLVIKPTYGKDSIFNKSILNHEGFFSIGGGLVSFETEFADKASEEETAFSLSFGIGRKYFLGKNFNVSLEVRDILVFKEDETENNIYLGMGLNYRFEFSSRKAPVLKDSNSIYDYLKDDE